MQHIFLIIILHAGWIVHSARGNESPEFPRVQSAWTRCCRASDSLCINETCYAMEWSSSSWYSVRNRCRLRFSDHSPPVDLVDIDSKEEASSLHKLLREQTYHRRRRSKNNDRNGVWTSGTKCSTGDSDDKSTTKFVWRSNNRQFPDWLLKEINDDNSVDEDCQFLVITPDKDSSKLDYKFEDEKEEYFGVCKLVKPGPPKTTTQTKSTKTTARTKLVSTPSTTASVTKTTTTATVRTTNRSFSPSEKSSATTESTTRPTRDSKSKTITSDSTTTSRATESTKMETTTEEASFSGCKKREASGIKWPNTLPGETVKQKCPTGMKGTAEWTCDAASLTFQPPKPRIRNCRHEWLDNLQKEIESRKDAVELSKRIANKTTHTSLSHGDLSALVNLTGKLLKLFESQRKSILTHVHQQQPPSYHFAKSMVTSYSHVLRSEAASAWTDLDQSDQLQQASRILQQISTTGHHLSCAINSDNILQHTLTEENINLQTFLLEEKDRDDHHSYKFPHGISGEGNNSLTLSGRLDLKNWLSPTCTGKRKTAVGILYKNLQQFLNKDDSNAENSTSVVVSPVISFSFNTNFTESQHLPDGATVQIELERYAEPNGSRLYHKPRCAFWNFSLGEFGDWDSRGCWMKFSNITHTICSCNHLTNFAVLMDVNNNINTDDIILQYLTIVCCAVSSFSLLITFLALLMIRSLRCRRSTITCNLCICLLIVNLLMLFGFDQTKFVVLCAIIAGLLHFFVLAAFCWMLLEGLHLYQMVVLVFSHSSHVSIAYFYSFGYGIPAIIVAVSAAIEHEGYGRPDACWLGDEDGFMWSFVGPMATIILVNLVIFVWTMKSASSAKIKKEQSFNENAKAWVKGSLSILCLLGLTWAVGFLFMSGVLYFTSYIFTVLNGLQGVFIFIFHILFNEKAINAFVKTFRKRVVRRGLHRRRPETLTSTQQLRGTRSTSSGLTASTRTDDGHVNSNTVYCPTRISTENSNNTSFYVHLQPPHPAANGNAAFKGKVQKSNGEWNGRPYRNR